MTFIDIVVAEDDYFTRTGICSLLEKEPEFQVVGSTDSGLGALDLVRQKQPRVLLLDLSMPPGIGGIEVIKTLRAEENPVLIIALTQEKRMITAVQKEGGNGFIPKDKFQMFIPTVQCVAKTGSNIFINPEISASYRQLLKRVEDAQLSEQEMEVWQLIGFTNEEIARRVFRAPGRVRNIVTELYCKLNIPKNGKVPQKTQAQQLARLLGILKEPEIQP